jgi:hypothetical protein
MTRVKEWITSSSVTTTIDADWNAYFAFLGPLEDGDTLLRVRMTCALEIMSYYNSIEGNYYPRPWHGFQTVLTLSWKEDGSVPTPYFSGGDFTEDYLWVSQVDYEVAHYRNITTGVTYDAAYCLNTSDSRLIDTKSERVAIGTGAGVYLCIDNDPWLEGMLYTAQYAPLVTWTARMLVEHADS